MVERATGSGLGGRGASGSLSLSPRPPPPPPRRSRPIRFHPPPPPPPLTPPLTPPPPRGWGVSEVTATAGPHCGRGGRPAACGRAAHWRAGPRDCPHPCASRAAAAGFPRRRGRAGWRGQAGLTRCSAACRRRGAAVLNGTLSSGGASAPWRPLALAAIGCGGERRRHPAARRRRTYRQLEGTGRGEGGLGGRWPLRFGPLVSPSRGSSEVARQLC